MWSFYIIWRFELKLCIYTNNTQQSMNQGKYISINIDLEFGFVTASSGFNVHDLIYWIWFPIYPPLIAGAVRSCQNTPCAWGRFSTLISSLLLRIINTIGCIFKSTAYGGQCGYTGSCNVCIRKFDTIEIFIYILVTANYRKEKSC